MLIRSQGKKLLINFEATHCLEVLEIDDMFAVAASLDTASESIGYYSTEEKAVKVLDMIQSKYLGYYHLKGGPAILKGSIDIAENMWEVPKVFQMPAESEVE